MKKAICTLVLFTASTLSASTIPQYEISAIDTNILTFSNAAVLNVYFENYIALQGWQVGDAVELVSTSGVLFTSHPIKIIDNRIIICPIFLVRNLTKDDAQIAAWLEQSPITPNPGTFFITSIDTGDRMITLNDSSSWAYSADDQFNVNFWQLDDIVMIGVNGVFPPSFYDAVLLNANQQNMIRAIQQ